MEKNKEKAFDFAYETTKQLITLATAIITLTVTFSKDVIGSINQDLRLWLASTWAVFIISILLGILTMMSLTGTLDPMKNGKNKDSKEEEKQQDSQEKPVDMSINGQNVKSFSKYQIMTFLIGLILTVIFGYKSLSLNSVKETKGYKIIRQTKFGSDSTIYKDTIIIPIR